MTHRERQSQDGQSLLEVILAMAIFGLLAAVITSLLVGAFSGLEKSGDVLEAEALADEGIAMVRHIRDRAWNRMYLTTTSAQLVTGDWEFNDEGVTEQIGMYTRTFVLEDICRDSGNNIIDCPGGWADPHEKKVMVTVSWTNNTGQQFHVTRETLMSNWDSRDWTQTDWSGGRGQNVWSDETAYESDTGYVVNSTVGQISILSGDTSDNGFNYTGSSSFDWPFDTASNYIYDPNKIQVSGGYARLKSTGGSTVSGDLLNAEFTANANNWTYYDWEQPGGTNPTGSYVSTGGNPGGYVNIDLAAKKNSTVSGFWEQAFTTSVNDPSIATTTFDWIVEQFSSDYLSSFQLYVFVDSASGAPTVGTEVWSSGEINGTTSWTNQSEIDVAARLGTAGTYYIKIAARAVLTSGPGPSPAVNNRVGFDNVKLHWQDESGGAYPTDSPSIYPDTSLSVPGLSTWSNFSENALKDGGEIYYQLSDDDGSTWQYWNGSIWTIATSSLQSNVATVINTQITNFPITNAQILFKAFLESDGSQEVRLDNVNIGYTTPGSVWNFNPWNVGPGEVTPTGSHNSSGGNPTGYVDITFPAGGGDEVGGYWVQPFTVYKDNADLITIDFDYKVIDFNGSPNVADIRVYLDTTSGNPTNQVGVSVPVTAEGSWTSAITIDATTAATVTGTYYLKLAFWLETPVGGGSNATGPFTIGFDNVNIDLGNAEYYASNTLLSSAFNMSDSSPVQVIDWDEDLSACLNNDCDIDFDLRTAPDAAGAPGVWTPWYGADGLGTIFTTSTGSLVPLDLNGNQWVQYRVNLNTEGYDTPILKEVKVNYR